MCDLEAPAHSPLRAAPPLDPRTVGNHAQMTGSWGAEGAAPTPLCLLCPLRQCPQRSGAKGLHTLRPGGVLLPPACPAQPQGLTATSLLRLAPDQEDILTLPWAATPPLSTLPSRFQQMALENCLSEQSKKPTT